MLTVESKSQILHIFQKEERSGKLNGHPKLLADQFVTKFFNLC